MNILGLARHGLNGFEQIAIIMVLVVAFISLAYAWLLRGTVLKKDKGTQKMQEVWNAIKVGANSYLNRQLRTILPAIGILTVALFLSVAVVPPSAEAVSEFGQANAQWWVAIGRTAAFILGATFSLLVGQLGMRMAIEANVRAASAARRGFNEALSIAYYAGTITGMLTDGLGLLGGTVIFMIFGTAAPDALLGFGFGGTLLALFMRVGGGIYTKAADVGADLVGKVEKDIPEDDPRNAAVIADLVGDNVGDCAGMAADIFESYEVTIVSALILGLALVAIEPDPNLKLRWIVYPLIIRGIGVISSILGTFTVPIWEKFPIKFLRAHDAEESMFRSYEVSSVNTIFWSFVVAILYAHDWRLAMLTSIGVGLAVAFNPLTSYFTSTKRTPVKEIVKSTKTGPATTILTGLSVGMESSVYALIVIVISFICAILLYGRQVNPETGVVDATYVLYAVAMVGIGMLSHTGNNVAMDSYGPISDNANGIGEMAWHDLDDKETTQGAPDHGRPGCGRQHDQSHHQGRCDCFGSDCGGQPVRFLHYGYRSGAGSIGRAGHAALSAYRIRKCSSACCWAALCPGCSARSPSAPFPGQLARLWKKSAPSSKSRALWKAQKTPDYARVVAISTASAQKELIPLAVIAVLTPLVVGLVLQVEALGGFLAGVILSGQLLAVFMANAGGAWDNAKKSIEDEPRNLAANTGKGSERHKAGVVGDTVGDPLKDTAGPALNPMIKVVNLVSLLAAPDHRQISEQHGCDRMDHRRVTARSNHLGCSDKQ